MTGGAWVLLLAALAQAPTSAEKGAIAKPRPRTMLLPATGDLLAGVVFAKLEAMTGMGVEANDGIREQKLKIEESLRRKKLGAEELKLVLSANRIFLFPHRDAKGRAIHFASRDPAWSPKKSVEQHRRSFEITPRKFEAIAQSVEALIVEHNTTLQEDQPPSRLAADARRSVVIVQTSSQELLDRVAALIAERDQPDPSAPRLFTYFPKKRHARQLETTLAEAFEKGALNASEREAVSIVVPQRRNVLWIRTTPALYEKVTAILTTKDR